MPAESRTLRILVVEQDQAYALGVCEALREQGHMAVSVAGVTEARLEFLRSSFDVALVGLAVAESSELLRELAQSDVGAEALALTEDPAEGVRAMKLGAFGYIRRAASPEELGAWVARAAATQRLEAENRGLRLRLRKQASLPPLIAEDAAMRDLLAALTRLAATDLPVVLEGEAGSGKRLLAATLHHLSPRAGAALVPADCRGPAERLAIDLFGAAREPGALEAAAGGVVRLDAVAALPAELQEPLLRVLETRELCRQGSTRPIRVDVRVVAVSEVSLKREMQAGRLREDLYYRLSGVTLRVPPLRERKADIPPLARYLLARLAPGRGLSAGAIAALVGYAWPGNVPELEAVIARAVVVARGEVIEASELGLPPPAGLASSHRPGLTLAQLEREYITAVLAQNSGHRGKTARDLGIDPKTLYNKIGSDRPRKKIVT